MATESNVKDYLKKSEQRFRSFTKSWEDFTNEVPQKLKSLVLGGVRSSVTPSYSEGNWRKASLAMKIDTQDANAYVEQVITKVNETSEEINDYIKTLDRDIQSYFDDDIDSKFLVRLIDHMNTWIAYMSKMSISIFSRTVNFAVSDEISKIQTKWKKISTEECRKQEAKKYGVSLSDLPTHRKYLAAKEQMSKAQTSHEYTAVITSFNKIKSYKDSEKLIEQCRAKAADKEEAEHHAEAIIQKWQFDCERVRAERIKQEKIMKESLCREYGSKLEVLKQTQANELSEHSKKRSDLTLKIAQLQKKLESTGFFAVSRKKTLKAEIGEAQAAEANAAREVSSMISRHEAEKKALQDALSKALTTIPDKVKKELPLPIKTSEVIAAEKSFKITKRGKL